MTTPQQQLSLTQKQAATLLLTMAAGPSPAQWNDPVREVVLRNVEPLVAVELIVWLSVLHLLHHLNTYYTIVEAQ